MLRQIKTREAITVSGRMISTLEERPKTKMIKMETTTNTSPATSTATEMTAAATVTVTENPRRMTRRQQVPQLAENYLLKIVVASAI